MTETAKSIPLGAALTYIAHIRGLRYPPSLTQTPLMSRKHCEEVLPHQVSNYYTYRNCDVYFFEKHNGLDKGFNIYIINNL